MQRDGQTYNIFISWAPFGPKNVEFKQMLAAWDVNLVKIINFKSKDLSKFADGVKFTKLRAKMCNMQS